MEWIHPIEEYREYLEGVNKTIEDTIRRLNDMLMVKDQCEKAIREMAGKVN